MKICIIAFISVTLYICGVVQDPVNHSELLLFLSSMYEY